MTPDTLALAAVIALVLVPVLALAYLRLSKPRPRRLFTSRGWEEWR